VSLQRQCRRVNPQTTHPQPHQRQQISG
jgi:hypothetical protein